MSSLQTCIVQWPGASHLPPNVRAACGWGLAGCGGFRNGGADGCGTGKSTTYSHDKA